MQKKRAYDLLYIIIIIAQSITQDHDLQRNPVAFLPRNRERQRRKAIKHGNMHII